MNKKYPISVITPFYEVDLNLFEHTFKSVVDQDFCFEKDDDNRLTIYIEIKDNKK